MQMLFRKCEVSVAMAYCCMIYVIASVYYLIVTRQFGTPFYNAIAKDPKLVEIKKKSASKRRKAFYCGIAVGVIVLFIFKPFLGCADNN